MKTTRTIERGQLEELAFSRQGTWVGNWVLIDRAQLGEEHRWYHEATMVLQHRDFTYWGVDYERGLSEIQETTWPWDDKSQEEIELYPMESHVELRITYTRSQ